MPDNTKENVNPETNARLFSEVIRHNLQKISDCKAKHSASNTAKIILNNLQSETMIVPRRGQGFGKMLKRLISFENHKLIDEIVPIIINRPPIGTTTRKQVEGAIDISKAFKVKHTNQHAAINVLNSFEILNTVDLAKSLNEESGTNKFTELLPEEMQKTLRPDDTNMMEELVKIVTKKYQERQWEDTAVENSLRENNKRQKTEGHGLS